MITRRFIQAATLSLVTFLGAVHVVAEEPTQVYFGDTHLHTSFSMDAFLYKNRTADPDTAYRFAKGQPVVHPYRRVRAQLDRPLDFLVVSDHAEFLGGMRAIYNDELVLEDQGFFSSIKNWFFIRTLKKAMESDDPGKMLNFWLPGPAEDPNGDPVADPNNQGPGGLGDTSALSKATWGKIIEAAERHNEPGVFTSFIGWEWSSIPSGANLHRVVVTPDVGDTAGQYIPFSSIESQYPEDLWAFLERTSEETGARFIAIPHNSNVSKGFMFADQTVRGDPITREYAERRNRWEPIAEVTQYKGDSETHPELSPDDEFADYETYPYIMQKSNDLSKTEKYVANAGDYARSGLKTGLTLDSALGINPFQFGMIGSTDSHNGMSAADERNFWGKFSTDSIPEAKMGSALAATAANGWSMEAAGLAAVWATENSREAIFAGMQRREVYATTGTRMRVRMFAGWSFPDGAADSEDMAQIGYESGVPMGAEIAAAETSVAESGAESDVESGTESGAESGAESDATEAAAVMNTESADPASMGDEVGNGLQLLIRVSKDPVGANLDRVQVVKGWLDQSGDLHEKVYNVAWAGDRDLDAEGRLPDVGSTVDLSVPTYTNDIGAAELSSLWVDPDFDAEQKAFYYVRALEIPTPRHSTYDAIALEQDFTDEQPPTLQERAYSSPIWYNP